MQLLSEVKQAEKAYNSKAKDMLGGKLKNKIVSDDSTANIEKSPA